MPWMTLGDALGYGLAQGVNNFVSTNNTFEQQRQQQANWQAQMAAQEAARTQQQTNWQAEQDRLVGNDQYTRDRQARQDGIAARENEKNGLAGSMNSFMQGLQNEQLLYGPTLKDGSPNPQFNPALYQAAQERAKRVQKLWTDVHTRVGSGEGFDDARRAFLAFTGGEDTAPAQQTPSGSPAPSYQPGQPIPEVQRQQFPDFQPMVPVTGAGGPPPSSAPAEQAPATPPPAQGAAPALPDDVRTLSGKDLLTLDIPTLTQRYGQAGAEYAIAKRAAYVQQVQKQQADAAKVRADGWDTQLKELAKRPDLTGDQRLAMATITSLMAKPELTDQEAEQLAGAFQLLTPRMYDATSWQKVLETKDPATILAQWPVYRKYAPNVVEGFDPTPYQRILDDDHELTVAKIVTEGSVQAKNEADTNYTNVQADGYTQKLPGEITGQQAKNDNLDADTSLKKAQADLYNAQRETAQAKTAGEKAVAEQKAREANQKIGMSSLVTISSFPPKMTYKQLAQQNPGLVADMKRQLGLTDAGLEQLWRQGQYKYGLGITGENLKNQLAQEKVNTQKAQTTNLKTQTAATAQGIIDDNAVANSNITVNQGRANASNAAAAASRAQANQINALTPGKVAVQRATAANLNTRTAVTAAQGAANVALTNTRAAVTAATGTAQVNNLNARTGEAQSRTQVNYANAGRVVEQVKNDRARTNAYVEGVKGNYAVDMAQVKNLNARTLLVQAQDPNSPYYNPRVAAAKAGDPLKQATTASNLKYKQADQALQSANALQGQINSLKKEGVTVTGAFDATRLSPQSQAQLKNLVAQRDKLMAQSLNFKKAGDTIIQDAMLSDAKKNPPASTTPSSGKPAMPKLPAGTGARPPTPTSGGNVPTTTIRPASSTPTTPQKPTAPTSTMPALPKLPKYTGGGSQRAAEIYAQNLLNGIKSKNPAQIKDAGEKLFRFGYTNEQIQAFALAAQKAQR